MRVPPELNALISRQGSRAASPAVRALTDELLARYGDAVQAILLYGSCLRTGEDRDGLVDLYLLVESYRAVYRKRIQVFLNTLLPPNVFYLELPLEGGVVRAKYAVLTLTDFQRGTSTRWFHSYLWGRFAQPTALLYARNSHVAEQVEGALARAAITFITRVLPRLPACFEARELWRQGLSLSYRAELRAERPDGLVRLFDAAPDHYQQLTDAAMAAVPFPVAAVSSTPPIRYQARIPAWRRCGSRLAWAVRRLQGKLLSVLRLLKGLVTFRGGVDYILWKIERHSGVTVEVTPRQRRHPLLAGWSVFWRLYRHGAFR